MVLLHEKSVFLYNGTDNLTEMFPVAGKTEIWAPQHRIAGQVGEQTLVRNDALEHWEGLKAHVHQVPPFILGTQLCFWCLVDVGRLRSFSQELVVREKGPEPADNRRWGKNANAKEDCKAVVKGMK